jgi:hypothetical protein
MLRLTLPMQQMNMERSLFAKIVVFNLDMLKNE